MLADFSFLILQTTFADTILRVADHQLAIQASHPCLVRYATERRQRTLGPAANCSQPPSDDFC